MEKWKEEITVNKSLGEEYFLSCERCSNETRHTVLASVNEDAESETYPMEIGTETVYTSDMWYKAAYQVIQCRGCDTISFRRSSFFSEDTDFDPRAGSWFPVERVEFYPKRLLKNKPLKELSCLPTVVRDIYTETRSALANSESILGGMGIRALVESVCKEKKAKGKNLEERIDDLVSKGLLRESSAEILHRLRIMGNESAHDGRRHEEKNLLLALEVVEHLLTDVYIIPSLASVLPKR